MRCHHCGAKGPSGNSVEQAFILWNERTTNTDPTSQREKTDGQPIGLHLVGKQVSQSGCQIIFTSLTMPEGVL